MERTTAITLTELHGIGDPVPVAFNHLGTAAIDEIYLQWLESHSFGKPITETTRDNRIRATHCKGEWTRATETKTRDN